MGSSAKSFLIYGIVIPEEEFKEYKGNLYEDAEKAGLDLECIGPYDCYHTHFLGGVIMHGSQYTDDTVDKCIGREELQDCLDSDNTIPIRATIKAFCEQKGITFEEPQIYCGAAVL